jgi:hypothetical protein
MSRQGSTVMQDEGCYERNSRAAKKEEERVEEERGTHNTDTTPLPYINFVRARPALRTQCRRRCSADSRRGESSLEGFVAR